MEHEFLYKNKIYKVLLENKKGKYTATINSDRYQVDVYPVSSNCLSLIIGNRSYLVYSVEDSQNRYIFINGETYCFTQNSKEEVQKSKTKRETSSNEAKLTITAPMPGCVIKVDVKEGDVVEEGKCLAIIEAMKMETGLYAAISGKVKKVRVVKGKQVNAGETLIELEEI